MAAAECRWLQLVAEFDRREAWHGWGCLSAAHWLNYRCGLALGPAREKVRVARRLEELPLVVAALSTGELSYSKVRALTRVATDTNEEALVGLAGAMTASHLERVVRTYRQIPDDDAGEESDAKKETVYRRRRLDYRWTADDMLEIRALLVAEEGALVLAALRRAGDHLFRQPAHDRDGTDPTDDPRTDPTDDDVPAGTSQPTPGPGSDPTDDVPAGTPEPTSGRSGDPTDDVPAGTPGPTAGDGDADWLDAVAASLGMGGDTWDEPAAPYEVPGEAWEYNVGAADDDAPTRTPDADAEAEGDPADDWRARQADALVAMADTVVADGLRPGSGPSRYHVVIHLNTTADAATPAAWIDDGPILNADTARRLMCDASLSFALHGPDGTVVNVSTNAPTVASALSLAVNYSTTAASSPAAPGAATSTSTTSTTEPTAAPTA